ncbi:hypothetical protein ACFQMM_05750 [Saliphagus sp. GCM10025308]
MNHRLDRESVDGFGVTAGLELEGDVVHRVDPAEAAVVARGQYALDPLT